MVMRSKFVCQASRTTSPEGRNQICLEVLLQKAQSGCILFYVTNGLLIALHSQEKIGRR